MVITYCIIGIFHKNAKNVVEINEKQVHKQLDLYKMKENLKNVKKDLLFE